MTASNLKSHIEKKHIKKKEKKMRNVNRSKSGHCNTCDKTIKTVWNRHCRLVHNDEKERVTPTFGALVAEAGTLQSSAITEEESY